MMLSCLRANKKGINFSSVHDSFWCHPCDVDDLNQILREEVDSLLYLTINQFILLIFSLLLYMKNHYLKIY